MVKLIAGLSVQEYKRRYYRRNKPKYIRRVKATHRRNMKRKWEQKLRVLIWIYRELTKVAEYERDYPYIPPAPIIKARKATKPRIKSTIKKEFNWPRHIKAWAKVHESRAKPGAKKYKYRKGYEKEKKNG